MKNFEIVDATEITKWKTPSEWAAAVEYLPVTRIMMTCGGGMGGAQWYEHVHRVIKVESNKIMGFTRYDGKRISLNTSYIVSMEDFSLVKLSLDIREWKKLSNPGFCNNPDIEIRYLLLEDHRKLELIP